MTQPIRKTTSGISLPCEPWAAPYVAPEAAPPPPTYLFKTHEIQARVMCLMADGVGRTVKQIQAVLGTENYYHTFNACLNLDRAGKLTVQRFEPRNIPSIYRRAP